MKNIINIVKNQIKNRGSPNSSIQKNHYYYGLFKKGRNIIPYENEPYLWSLL